MPRLVGFGWFAALLEEQISEEIGRRIQSCDNGGGPVEHWPVVHVEPHSQADRLDAQRQEVPPRQRAAGLQPGRRGG